MLLIRGFSERQKPAVAGEMSPYLLPIGPIGPIGAIGAHLPALIQHHLQGEGNGRTAGQGTQNMVAGSYVCFREPFHTQCWGVALLGVDGHAQASL